MLTEPDSTASVSELHTKVKCQIIVAQTHYLDYVITAIIGH